MPGKKEYIRINPADSVAVALQPLAKGTDIILDDVQFALLEDIPQGHKFALHTIEEGEPVIKYGNPIVFSSACKENEIHGFPGRKSK